MQLSKWATQIKVGLFFIFSGLSMVSDIVVVTWILRYWATEFSIQQVWIWCTWGRKKWNYLSSNTLDVVVKHAIISTQSFILYVKRCCHVPVWLLCAVLHLVDYELTNGIGSILFVLNGKCQALFKSVTMLCGISNIPWDILRYFPYSELNMGNTWEYCVE